MVSEGRTSEEMIKVIRENPNSIIVLINLNGICSSPTQCKDVMGRCQLSGNGLSHYSNSVNLRLLIF